MPDWLSHMLAALGGTGFGGVLVFALRWKQATASEWQSITKGQGERIGSLEMQISELRREYEKRLDDVHREHQACLQAQTRMAAEVEILRLTLSRLYPPPATPVAVVLPASPSS